MSNRPDSFSSAHSFTFNPISVHDPSFSLSLPPAPALVLPISRTHGVCDANPPYPLSQTCGPTLNTIHYLYLMHELDSTAVSHLDTPTALRL